MNDVLDKLDLQLDRNIAAMDRAWGAREADKVAAALARGETVRDAMQQIETSGGLDSGKSAALQQALKTALSDADYAKVLKSGWLLA